jgi:uncharacterized protein YndB with AHSA1/START domain
VTSGEFHVTIQAPPERVWPWVADLSTHAQWSPKAYSMEWISGEPNAVGSRYRSVGWVPGDKHHTNEGEILESQPNERFRLRAEDKQGSYENSFVLTRQGDATEVTHRLEFLKMHGLAALMVPIIFPLSGKPDIRKRLALLKSTVEASE